MLLMWTIHSSLREERTSKKIKAPWDESKLLQLERKAAIHTLCLSTADQEYDARGPGI